jgi:hypothetical protein
MTHRGCDGERPARRQRGAATPARRPGTTRSPENQLPILESDKRPPRDRCPTLVPRQCARRNHCHDIVGGGLLAEVYGEILVDEGRGLERRTARQPDEVGTAETIETSAVAQQHVENATLGEHTAELGETEGQGSRRWHVPPPFA